VAGLPLPLRRKLLPVGSIRCEPAFFAGQCVAPPASAQVPCCTARVRRLLLAHSAECCNAAIRRQSEVERTCPGRRRTDANGPVHAPLASAVGSGLWEHPSPGGAIDGSVAPSLVRVRNRSKFRRHGPEARRLKVSLAV